MSNDKQDHRHRCNQLPRGLRPGGSGGNTVRDNLEFEFMMMLKGWKKYPFDLWKPDYNRIRMHKYLRKSEWRKYCLKVLFKSVQSES